MTNSKFDHDAIANDLQTTDMTTKEIAEKHGCSWGLVNSVKKKLKAGVDPDDKLAQNVARAGALRTRAQKFDRDFTLLGKWVENDVDGKVAEIIAKLEEAVECLTTAADLYEALPEEVMKRRSTSRKLGSDDELPPGTVLRLRDKYRDAYTSITASPDELRVLSVRDRSVLVEGSDGIKLFLPRKELELVDTDGE